MYQNIIIEVKAEIEDAKQCLALGFNLTDNQIRELQGFIRGLNTIETICERLADEYNKPDIG